MSKNTTDAEIDEILHKIGTDINQVYKSDPLNAWCTRHYFKLIDGRCVGCEAAQHLQALLLRERKKEVKRTPRVGNKPVSGLQDYVDNRIAELDAELSRLSEEKNSNELQA